MAVETLTYQGIDRAPTDYAGLQVCEELVNLRPVQGGVVPAKAFSVKMAEKPFIRVYVHHTGNGDRYVVIRRDNDGDAVKVTWVDEYGVVEDDLFNTPWRSPETAESIHVASAGNVLLISMCDTYNEEYADKAYMWKGDAYEEMEADAPPVTFSVSGGTDPVTVTQGIARIDTSSSPGDIVSSVESGINAAQENNPRLCLGPVIIATAFKTTDGNTFWSGNWKVYDPEPAVHNLSGRYKNSSYSWWANTLGMFTDFYAKYPDGGYVLAGLASSPAVFTEITLAGAEVTVSFDRLASGWDEDTSIIRSVELYASRPLPYLDASAAADGFGVDTTDQADPLGALMLPKADYKEMDLGGQLLYHQASIPLASLKEAAQTVELSFGGNIQVTEDTLDADAGALKRYGKLLSYNARFHYFESVAEIGVGMPYFADVSTGTRERRVLVRYAWPDGEELLHVGNDTTSNTYDYSAPFVIAPTLGVKEVITCVKNGTSWIVKKYRMTESSSYNYSYCCGGPYYDETLSASEWAASEMKGPAEGSIKSGVVVDEPAAINVTEQYNPFVFRVEHSYLAPGKVLDVQPQLAAVVDAAYGTDPLNVFTSRGLYALTQGSANVLYGAFVPVSQVVAEDGGLATEDGTFFLGAGALWLCTGRRIVLISDALSRGPHKWVRYCPGYERLSGGDYGASVTNPVYDMSALVSRVEFEKFTKGGRLAYNRFRQEIYASNPSYPYTYVISVKYRKWFKLSYRIWQDDKGGDLALTPAGNGLVNVVDLSAETPGHVDVHLQSRPFSMGYRYCRVHRIVATMRASLSGTEGDVAVAALYGSDNLLDWTLLAYAKRNGTTATVDEETEDRPLRISQLRTPTAARSWRYYTVCIGGHLPFDAEIGPVLVDYEPVMRRIG